MALFGCVEERSLFVPEVYEGQRARGALLAVQREGAQTLLALDLESGSGDPGLVEPYQEGDLTHLFLFTSTPAELFWPTGPIPLATDQSWPVPTPLLAQYCGRVGDEGLSLGDCEPSLLLEPRLPLPDAAACLRNDRCVVGQGTDARCEPCGPSPVTAPTPPEAPRPRSGPCPEGWGASGPSALCRPTWSPVPNCLTRYTAAAGCLPSLPPCATSTSTSALGPGDGWQAAIESSSPGVVHLGPGTFTTKTRLILPPGRRVIGACRDTILDLPGGAVVDRAGAARRLDNLALVNGASVRVVAGQILQLRGVELRPTGAIFALDVQSATVTLAEVDFRQAPSASLVRGQGASVRAEGLSAVGGQGIFELSEASHLDVSRSVVVDANYVISSAGGQTNVLDSHFSGFVEGGALIRGGSLRLLRSELIGQEQFAVTTSSTAHELRELYVATRGDRLNPLVFLQGPGEIRTCELIPRAAEGLVLGGGEVEVSDLWVTGGVSALAAKGRTVQANLQRVQVNESIMALTVNEGANVTFSDLTASTRCEGMSSVTASHTDLSRVELLLVRGGGECDGPLLGINLDRGARLIARDLRINGAAKGLVSRGNDLEAPQFDGERLEFLDNAADLELGAGRTTLRGLRSQTCTRWPSCTGLVVSPTLGRPAALDVEGFVLRDRATAFELDGGDVHIKDGSLESCPNFTPLAGLGLGPVPELVLERVRLLPCGAP